MVLLVDFPPRLRAERPVIVGEDGQVRMLLVELLQRVADRLGAAAGLSRQPPGNVGGAAAGAGQALGAADDLRPLRFAQLAEMAAAAHAIRVPLHEPVHRTLQETHPLAAVHDEPPADQPQPAPAGNRLGGDAESLGQFFHGQHAFAGQGRRHVGGVGEVLDEQPQVVPRLAARELQVGIGPGAIIRDAEAEIFVGVDSPRIQFPEQFFRLGDLFELLLAGANRTC